MEVEEGSKNQVVLYKSGGFTAGRKKRYFGLYRHAKATGVSRGSVGIEERGISRT